MTYRTVRSVPSEGAESRRRPMNGLEPGSIVPSVNVGSLTTTVALADLDGSSTLVAVTEYVPARFEGVYVTGFAVIESNVPAVEVQVTAVLPVPVTVAVNG
jgi:hypothetical protein